MNKGYIILVRVIRKPVDGVGHQVQRAVGAITKVAIASSPERRIGALGQGRSVDGVERGTEPVFEYDGDAGSVAGDNDGAEFLFRRSVRHLVPRWAEVPRALQGRGLKIAIAVRVVSPRRITRRLLRRQDFIAIAEDRVRMVRRARLVCRAAAQVRARERSWMIVRIERGRDRVAADDVAVGVALVRRGSAWQGDAVRRVRAAAVRGAVDACVTVRIRCRGGKVVLLRQIAAGAVAEVHRRARGSGCLRQSLQRIVTERLAVARVGAAALADAVRAWAAQGGWLKISA